MSNQLAHLVATRYVQPFREGGSMPALVETNDGALYVIKFHGAGQGARALVAELIGGELARALGLHMPKLAIVRLDPALARGEADPEIQDLLRASDGENIGLAFVPSALGFDAAARRPVSATVASRIVALDAFLMNVDRTARNPNLLWAGPDLWLIDHGAALYWHHGWNGDIAEARVADPFTRIRDHVLLPWAAGLAAAGRDLRAALTDDVIDSVVGALPAAWIADLLPSGDAVAARARYGEVLRARREATNVFITEAENARQRRV